MLINLHHALADGDCRDPFRYRQMILFFENAFATDGKELKKVKNLSFAIREGIRKMDPFIQKANSIVCPQCKNPCCTSKHGYYSYEDLIYQFALGLKPSRVISGKNDGAPCHYLLENGCSIERWRRPSGCTWYFCDPLLDYMEQQRAYREFDETLSEVARLWLEMTEEFGMITAKELI